MLLQTLMTRLRRTPFDLVLLGMAGVLTLAAAYVAMRRDAYLRSALDVAALVAFVALAGALLITLRLPSRIRARISLLVGVSIASLNGMELFVFVDPLRLR